jgi:hypothetical protein
MEMDTIITPINKTMVIFDENFNEEFKTSIDKIKYQYPEIVNEMKSNKHVDLEKTQKDLRNIFIQNQHLFKINIKLSNSNFCNAEFFVLLLSFVCDLSVCFDWYDIEKQYDIMRQLSKESYGKVRHYNSFNKDCIRHLDNIGKYNTQDLHCCCGHDCCPENMFILHNKHTGLNLMVASHCIRKTCSKIKQKDFDKAVKNFQKEDETYKIIIDNKKKFSIEKKQKKEKQEQIEDKLLCLFLSYMTKRKEFKKCQKCHLLKIPFNTNYTQCMICKSKTEKCLLSSIKFKADCNKYLGK